MADEPHAEQRPTDGSRPLEPPAGKSGHAVAAGDDANHLADSRAPALGQLEELKQQTVSAQQKQREAQ